MNDNEQEKVQKIDENPKEQVQKPENETNLHPASILLSLFPCNLCPAIFVQKKALTRHKAGHYGSKYKCSHCDLGFQVCIKIKFTDWPICVYKWFFFYLQAEYALFNHLAIAHGKHSITTHNGKNYVSIFMFFFLWHSQLCWFLH